MRVRIYNFLIVIGIALFANACQSQDELIQTSIQDGNTVLSVDDMEIISTGGSFSVAFTSNSSWKLKGRPGWLEVTKSSGRAGTTTIKMSAGCNDTRKDREAKLIFEAQDGSFSTPMKVRQTYPYLKIDVDTLSFNWNDCRTEQDGVVTDNNPQRIIISSNVDWRIEANPSTKADIVDFSHFTLSSEIGKGNDTLDIIPIKYNYSKEPYDIKLRLFPFVRDDKGNEIEIPATAANSYSLKLHQKNLRFLINDSSDDAEVEFHELKEDNDSTLIIDSEIKWSVAECPDWVEMKNKEGQDIKEGKDTVSVIFRANEANPECEKREGTIKLTTGAGAYREIKVAQKPYVFELEASDINIGNDDTTSVHNVVLTTTGTWEIPDDIPDWLKVEPSKCEETTPVSGKKTHEIKISAKEQNLKFVDYSHLLRVCSSMNSLSDTVQVKQKKFEFDVVPSDTLANLPTLDTTKHTVTIISSGKWKIKETPPDWIEVSQSDGEKGDTLITIRAKHGNDNKEDRPATLTVVSVNHEDDGEDVTRPIEIKQSKFIFEVTPTADVTIPAYKDSNSFSMEVRCSAGWTLSHYPSWIEPNTTKGTGDSTIVFNCETNKGKIKRDSVIIVKSDYTNEEKSITINQDAFVFDDTSESFNVVVMNKKSFLVSFDLTAEAPWSLLSDDSSWLHPSKENGTGSGDISFSPDPNPDLVERVGEATIHSAISGEDKHITFVQEKYVFDSTSEEFSYTELDKKRNEIKITSSGPWTIPDVPEWMHVFPKEEGDSSAIITVYPDKNIDTNPTGRNDSFHIVSTLHEADGIKLQKKISVSQEAFKFDDSPKSFSYETLEERTDTVPILCSGSWKAQNVPTWVTLSSTTGNGDQSGIAENITITSRPNLWEEPRDTIISIVSDDNRECVKEITLYQEKFVFDVPKDTIVYSSPLDVTSKSFVITCSAAWTADSDKDWLEVSTTGDGSLTLTPEANIDTLKRSATITIVSDPYNLSKTVPVSQAAYEFDSSIDSVHFDACPTGDVTKSITCSGNWTVASTTHPWVDATPSTTRGNGTITIHAQDNQDEEKRTATITVTSKDNPNLQKQFKITQSGHQMDISSSTLDFKAYPEGSQSITVTTTCPWTASSDKTWLTVSPTTANGKGSITISAGINDSPSPRTGTITIQCSNNSTLQKTVTVNQAAYSDSESLSFEAAGSSQEKTITYSGEWPVSCDADWISVSPKDGGEGNGFITITVAPNTGEERTDQVTVTSVDNSSLKKEFTIIQKEQ